MINMIMRQNTNFLSSSLLKQIPGAILIFSSFLICLSASAGETTNGFHITTPVSAIIKTVHVQSGQSVKQGELLLEFDDTLIDSDLTEAQAKKKLAQAHLAEAKKELARAQELYERTVLSEHDLQLAKISFRQASAQYASANNTLVHAQWNKTNSKLYAPFNGRVIELFSYPGQYVNNAFSAQALMILEKMID